MTIGFLYLVILLLGAILAMVTGLIRRITHPSELCDGVVVPSHEHWVAATTPLTDLLVLFITFFGVVGLLLYGFTTLELTTQLIVSGGAGLLAAVVLRQLLCAKPGPSPELESSEPDDATVVRTIPPGGFGQVQMTIGERTVKLAARSTSQETIEVGQRVEVTDTRDSVVLVLPVD